MIIKNDQDLKGMIEAGKVAAAVLHKMAARLRPGITTGQLDKIGEELMLHYKARSAPKVMYNFPGATCISIIPEVAHGIPGDRVIKPGDLVNIDVSIELNGYYGDNGMSIPVELEDPLALKVCQVSQEARAAAIAAARPGGRINEIGKAVEEVAGRHGLHIIKNLCGHGLGRSLHEAPETILNYYSRFERGKIAAGQVLALEPFISDGPEAVTDGGYNEWALVVPKGHYVAQFEHSIIVLEGQTIITTLQPEEL